MSLIVEICIGTWESGLNAEVGKNQNPNSWIEKLRKYYFRSGLGKNWSLDSWTLASIAHIMSTKDLGVGRLSCDNSYLCYRPLRVHHSGLLNLGVAMMESKVMNFGLFINFGNWDWVPTWIRGYTNYVIMSTQDLRNV
jgi:hypothetical protein